MRNSRYKTRGKTRSEVEVEQCQTALLSKNRPAKRKHIEILIKVTDSYQQPSEVLISLVY